MEAQGVSCRCGVIACNGEKCNALAWQLMIAYQKIRELKQEQKHE